jgi:hypothetical protein
MRKILPKSPKGGKSKTKKQKQNHNTTQKKYK